MRCSISLAPSRRSAIVTSQLVGDVTTMRMVAAVTTGAATALTASSVTAVATLEMRMIDTISEEWRNASGL